MTKTGGAGFLESDAFNLILFTWKAAKDHQGYRLRVLETAGKSNNVMLRLPRWKLKLAQLTSGVEENLNKSLSISHTTFEVTMKPNEIVTVRI